MPAIASTARLTITVRNARDLGSEATEFARLAGHERFRMVWAVVFMAKFVSWFWWLLSSSTVRTFVRFYCSSGFL
jgi:hypothetical protein